MEDADGQPPCAYAPFGGMADLRISPDTPVVNGNLGASSVLHGRADTAVELMELDGYRTALRLGPDFLMSTSEKQAQVVGAVGYMLGLGSGEGASITTTALSQDLPLSIQV